MKKNKTPKGSLQSEPFGLDKAPIESKRGSSPGAFRRCRATRPAKRPKEPSELTMALEAAEKLEKSLGFPGSPQKDSSMSTGFFFFYTIRIWTSCQVRNFSMGYTINHNGWMDGLFQNPNLKGMSKGIPMFMKPPYETITTTYTKQVGLSD